MSRYNHNEVRPHYEERLVEAAVKAIGIRIYMLKPYGYRNRDGLWYPSEIERCPECWDLPEDTVYCGEQLYKHCHSEEHIAANYEVDLVDVQLLCNKMYKYANIIGEEQDES